MPLGGRLRAPRLPHRGPMRPLITPKGPYVPRNYPMGSLAASWGL